VIAEALKLSQLGWSLIPLKPHSKEPLVPWKALQKRKLTEPEIADLFEQYPDANIGVVTGTISRIFVLDADAPEVVKRWGTPETPIAETSRGRHYYYQLPDSAVPSIVGVADGVDIKAEGGYVVAPPSVHPSGRCYQWVIPPRGLDPFGAEPAPPPAWLMELLSRHRARSGTLVRIVQGVPEGQRNISSAALIGKLLGCLPPDDWESIAWPLACAWNARNSPPLPDRELRRVFEKIAAREQQRRLTAESKELRLTRALQKISQHFKLSQRQLSKITQIPQQTLSRWFAEATESPPKAPLWGNGSNLSEKCRIEAKFYVESDSRVTQMRR
jgi:DNA-binding transcriptional regulator YiaG